MQGSDSRRINVPGAVARVTTDFGDATIGGYVEENDPKVATYAVSFRLQRTTTEAGFISVPVTSDLMIRQPDGTARIDVDKMAQRSVELAESTDVEWHIEEQRVELHPVQMAPPESGA